MDLLRNIKKSQLQFILERKSVSKPAVEADDSMILKDYKKLLELSLCLDGDFTDYLNHIVDNVSRIFNYRMIILLQYEKNSNNETYVERVVMPSNRFMNANEVREYTNRIFYSDYFHIDKINKLRNPNYNNRVFRIEDVTTREAFAKSEIGKLLFQFNFNSQVALCLSQSSSFPQYVLFFYKSVNEADFTQYECRLFNNIAQILSKYLDKNNKIKKMETIVWMLGDHINDLYNSGVAIVDSERNLIYQNSSFIGLARDATSSINIPEIMDKLYKVLHESSEKPKRINLYANLTNCKLNDYTISFVNKDIKYRGIFRKFIIIEIKKNKADIETSDYLYHILDSYHLSKREEDVVKLLLENNSYQQIAHSLYISESTVKSHVSRIYSKLGVKSRSEAVKKLLEVKKE